MTSLEFEPTIFRHIASHLNQLRYSVDVVEAHNAKERCDITVLQAHAPPLNKSGDIKDRPATLMRKLCV
jgi:hypothetical protein